jgi:hypothetical protein
MNKEDDINHGHRLPKSINTHTAARARLSLAFPFLGYIYEFYFNNNNGEEDSWRAPSVV